MADILNSRPAFLLGEGMVSPILLAHIKGPESASQTLYIEGPSFDWEEGSTGVFIQGEDRETPLTGSVGTYIEGGGMTSSLGAYIFFDSAKMGVQDCYIEGISYEYSEPKGAIRLHELQQQYAMIPDIREYDHMDQFSMNIWVKFRKDADLFKHGIVVKEGVLETYLNQINNSFTMRIKIGGVWEQASTLSVVRNRWHMITITYSGTVLRFYLDGFAFLSKNVTGDMAHNDLPWYLGRFPSVGTFSEMDLSMFQIWNYALSAVEVSDLFFAPHRLTCKKCYIVTDIPIALDASKPSVITSYISSDNPLKETLTLGCAISVDASVYEQRAFIVAGGEETVVFDQVFTTDFTERVRFDQIINVNSGFSSINQIQLGSVVYPITRYSNRYIRVPTKDNPLTLAVNQGTYIMRYNYMSAEPRRAYIPVVSASQVMKQSHITSYVDAEQPVLHAFIQNQQAESMLNSYVKGAVPSVWEWFIRSYVHAETNHFELESSAPSFINGVSALEGHKKCFIKTGQILTVAKNVYLHSEAFEFSNFKYAYINGGASARRSRDSYIDGHYVAVGSQDSYISAIPTVRNFVTCYTSAPTPLRAVRKLGVYGNEPVTGEQHVFIQAGLQEIETKNVFLWGSRGRHYATWLYLLGEVAVFDRYSHMAFIVNSNPVASLNAFIGSGPPDNVRCYIVNAGNTSDVKSSYVVA